jgi:DNA repair protein RadC
MVDLTYTIIKSGNIKPSKADKTLTNRIKNTGKMLGIGVDDHVILTAEKLLLFKAKIFYSSS